MRAIGAGCIAETRAARGHARNRRFHHVALQMRREHFDEREHVAAQVVVAPDADVNRVRLEEMTRVDGTQMAVARAERSLKSLVDRAPRARRSSRVKWLPTVDRITNFLERIGRF